MFGAISRAILHLLGWRIVGRYPEELRKFIVIVMPHTSNWDFPLGILVRSAMGADIKFLGKHTLFRPPFGWFFRWLGGYPVDRSQRRDLVAAVVGIFNREADFVVTIAPEGTRGKADRLKTGFYYMALGAGVPVVMVRFDYGRREVVIREPFRPTGDKDADFRQIIDFFRVARGRNPWLGIDEDVRY